MEEQTYERFLFFSHTKNKFFSKTLKISPPKSFFPTMTKIFHVCETSKMIEVEDRIQKTDGEDEETALDFLAQYEVYGYLKKWWWIC